MQIGESVAPPAVENPVEEESEEKKPLKIRISLFFDGTLNNRRNITAREKNEEAYQKHSNKTDDSYENGRTNVAIMESFVEGKSKGFDVALKVYVEGPGTENLSSDQMSGFAFGAGDTGVKAKVAKGIFEALTLLQDADLNPAEYTVETVALDVVGFSRGAAGARFCIHELLKGDNPFHGRLRGLGFDASEEAIEVQFAGLYDSVASYKGGQILHTDNWLLKLKSVELAKQAVHLVAADEHRANFPLHNINSAGNKGKEYYLPGVHSDLGGSYNTAEFGAGTSSTSTENMVINKASPPMIDKDRENLIALGWYETSEFSQRVTRYTRWGSPAEVELRVVREDIKSSYSNIPLKIMAKFARESGVSIRSRLGREADKLIRSNSLLAAMEARVNEYVQASASSTEQDWHGYDQELRMLRHDHLHFSAHLEGGVYKAMKPRFSRGKRKRYKFNG